MRATLKMASALSASLLLLLCSCTGSVIQPLPPGQGPGFYNGRFTDEADSIEYGQFTMRVEETGEAHGSGQLNGRDVDIDGVLDGATGEFSGAITDSLTQLGGYFDGSLGGSTLFGEFSLDQGVGEPDFYGYWDAVIEP